MPDSVITIDANVQRVVVIAHHYQAVVAWCADRSKEAAQYAQEARLPLYAIRNHNRQPVRSVKLMHGIM